MQDNLSPASLTNADLQALEVCEEYPIRAIEHIQPHGCLLVVQRADLTVVQVSANTQEWLGVSPEDLLGQPLSALLSTAVMQALQAALGQDQPLISQEIDLPHADHSFWGSFYPQNEIILLELEPKALDQGDDADWQDQVIEVAAQLDRSKDLTEWAQILTREVQLLLQFDRVMVYRLLPDQSGTVIAEAKPSLLESYLGLHFPATDIPAEARSLFLQSPLRWIPNIHYSPAPLVPAINPITASPLDLSQAWLRGVSPPHVTYLSNMGVASSITLPLVDEYGVWGLVACHHSQPRLLDRASRNAFILLGKVANLELIRHQQQRRQINRQQHQQILNQLHQSLQETGQATRQILMQAAPTLLRLFSANGLAVVFDRSIATRGETPNHEELLPLITWLSAQGQTLWHTDCLGQEYPDCRHWAHQAAGLMAINLVIRSPHPKSYHLLLFRPEQIQTVTWAGQLSASVTLDEAGQPTLCPRTSFDLWQETVQGRSQVWTPQDLDFVSELRNTLMLAALKISTVSLEKATEQAQIASRAKSEFLANMSHEIRTPMNAVLGFTTLLQPLVHNPVAQGYLDAITSSGETLLALINDILDLSKIEAGQMSVRYEPIHLNHVIKDIQIIFKQKALEKGLKLRTIYDESIPPMIVFDEMRLRQILFNLVGNALKFTEKGHVDIEVNCIPSPQRDKTETIYLEISVTDTGIGIPEEGRTLIFDAFAQIEGSLSRRYEGTGLGLTITHRLTELMGGTLTLESEVGKGSRFICKFPRVEVAHEASYKSVNVSRRKRQQGADINQLPKMTILIADDIRSNRDLLAGYLSETIHSLIFACDGKETIELAQQHHPDLILLDWRMPNLDGQEAALILQANPETCNIPIIFVTASLHKEDSSEYIIPSPDNVLLKPVDQQALFKAIQRVILGTMEANLSKSDLQKTQSRPLTTGEKVRLKQQLSAVKQMEWKAATAVLNIDDIEKFNLRLKSIHQQFPSPILGSYISQLSDQLDDFNWEKIPETLANFSTIVSTLNDQD